MKKPSETSHTVQVTTQEENYDEGIDHLAGPLPNFYMQEAKHPGNSFKKDD